MFQIHPYSSSLFCPLICRCDQSFQRLRIIPMLHRRWSLSTLWATKALPLSSGMGDPGRRRETRDPFDWKSQPRPKMTQISKIHEQKGPPIETQTHITRMHTLEELPACAIAWHVRGFRQRSCSASCCLRPDAGKQLRPRGMWCLEKAISLSGSANERDTPPIIRKPSVL